MLKAWTQQRKMRSPVQERIGYMGYLINGAVETECPQLRIIEPELFE